MVENILNKIILKKEKKLFELKKTISIDSLNVKIQESTNLLNFKESLSSFTLGFDNKTYDESRHVKEIDEKIKKDIFYSNAEDLKKNFLKISKFISDPIGDSSILPTFILSQKVRLHSNVVIGGDGGDETFFGYITFDAFLLAIIINSSMKIIRGESGVDAISIL